VGEGGGFTSIDLACGSHTASALPDLANDRMLVYNGSSSGACENIDIIGIPLSNPAAAAVIRQEPTADHPCHDIGIIYNADAKKIGCAGGTGFEIFSLDRRTSGRRTRTRRRRRS
jgi:hypothetical protein